MRIQPSFKPIYSEYNLEKLDEALESPIKNFDDQRVQGAIDHFIRGEEGIRFDERNLGPGWRSIKPADGEIAAFATGGNSCQTGQRLTIMAATEQVCLTATFGMFDGQMATRDKSTLDVNSGQVKNEGFILQCDGDKQTCRADGEMSAYR